MTMLPITYGYARVSKADDDAKNLDTQLRELERHGIRRDLILTDVASGRSMNRPGWRDLMSRIQAGDTLVVAFLDRLSRNFEEGGPNPGRADPAGHRHRGPAGEHRHPGGERGSQVLPAVHAGPGGLPGGLGQREDQAGPGPGSGGGETRGAPAGAVS